MLPLQNATLIQRHTKNRTTDNNSKKFELSNPQRNMSKRKEIPIVPRRNISK